MIKILFVCHGNICRSPMAEFVMKKLVRNLPTVLSASTTLTAADFEIASAATSTEEIGNPVYPQHAACSHATASTVAEKPHAR